MKKKSLLLPALMLCLLLAGCGKQDTAPTQTQPTAAPVAAAPIESTHPLGTLAQQVMAPYDSILYQIDAAGTPSISHTIPGDMFKQLSQAAQRQQALPHGGRYTFTTLQSSTHTYQATAMEATAALTDTSTPNPSDETPMDGTKMGDYAVTGGGRYERTFQWDVAQDLSQGRIEITTVLNGQNTGSEVFLFSRRSDGLYFVDAAADLTVDVDILQSSGTYLVAAGRMTNDAVDILEYHVTGLEQLPIPELMDFDNLRYTIDAMTTLHATPDNVSFSSH